MVIEILEPSPMLKLLVNDLGLCFVISCLYTLCGELQSLNFIIMFRLHVKSHHINTY